MMKFLFSLALLLASQFINAQNILNPSFDSVYFGGIDRVFQWITSDGVMMNAGTFGDTVAPLSPTTHYQALGLQFQELLWMGQEVDTTPYSSLALKLKSHPEKFKPNGMHYESMVVNGLHFYTDGAGYMDLSRCGIPFTDRPNKIKGYYNFQDLSAIGLNFGRVVVLLKKWNAASQQSDTIAFLDSKTDLGPTISWQAFEIPIQYQSAQVPDSIVVAFYANARPDQLSQMWLDEISFDYSGIGLLEGELLENSLVYPNPTSGIIYTDKLKDYSTYKIYNEQGQLLKSGELTNRISLQSFKSQPLFISFQKKDGMVKTAKVLLIR